MGLDFSRWCLDQLFAGTDQRPETLGQQSDVAIVASMRDTSRIPLINATIDRLRSVGVRVLGLVVNGYTDSRPRRLYESPLPR